ncbi:hypothetical protein M0802_015050 [Mischocyttarus mexicanus]|nr:hypothetical protein M0802_015050 [Mischocyttarus mexicanus]
MQDKSKKQKVKVKKKQSNKQKGQVSKKILVQFSQGLLKDKRRLIQNKSTTVIVFLGFSQREVKVKSKQSGKQESRGSKKLLVWLSQGQFNGRTRVIQKKSTTVGVFLVKTLKVALIFP